MTLERDLPPLRDLPPGHLEVRTEHLLAEISDQAAAHARRARRAKMLALPALAFVLIAAPAFALTHHVGGLFGINANTKIPVSRGWVRATLTNPAVLATLPGHMITVTWTIGEHARRVDPKFGAQGLFVRLKGTSGSATVAPAKGGHGHYSATIPIPKGGVQTIQIGIEGFTSGAGGYHTAPTLLPITNRSLPATR